MSIYICKVQVVLKDIDFGPCSFKNKNHSQPNPLTAAGKLTQGKGWCNGVAFGTVIEIVTLLLCCIYSYCVCCH